VNTLSAIAGVSIVIEGIAYPPAAKPAFPLLPPPLEIPSSKRRLGTLRMEAVGSIGGLEFG
jgi:hypothetical protein